MCDWLFVIPLPVCYVLFFVDAISYGQQASFIATKLTERGTLRDCLLSTDFFDLAWDQLLQFTLDATRGMADLHSRMPPIVHRDLKVR